MPTQYEHPSEKGTGLLCPVCQVVLEVRLARGRRSGKPFIMAVCPADGRHARLFINDASYVRQVLQRLERRGLAQAAPDGTGTGTGRG